MFCPDGEADRARFDALFFQFPCTQLGMGSGGRMDNQGFHISHIGKKGEYFERIDKLPGCFLSAFNLESENTSGTFREYFL